MAVEVPQLSAKKPMPLEQDTFKELTDKRALRSSNAAVGNAVRGMQLPKLSKLNPERRDQRLEDARATFVEHQENVKRIKQELDTLHKTKANPTLIADTQRDLRNEREALYVAASEIESAQTQPPRLRSHIRAQQETLYSEVHSLEARIQSSRTVLLAVQEIIEKLSQPIDEQKRTEHEERVRKQRKKQHAFKAIHWFRDKAAPTFLGDAVVKDVAEIERIQALEKDRKKHLKKYQDQAEILETEIKRQQSRIQTRRKEIEDLANQRTLQIDGNLYHELLDPDTIAQLEDPNTSLSNVVSRIGSQGSEIRDMLQHDLDMTLFGQQRPPGAVPSLQDELRLSGGELIADVLDERFANITEVRNALNRNYFTNEILGIWNQAMPGQHFNDDQVDAIARRVEGGREDTFFVLSTALRSEHGLNIEEARGELLTFFDYCIQNPDQYDRSLTGDTIAPEKIDAQARRDVQSAATPQQLQDIIAMQLRNNVVPGAYADMLQDKLDDAQQQLVKMAIEKDGHFSARAYTEANRAPLYPEEMQTQVESLLQGIENTLGQGINNTVLQAAWDSAMHTSRFVLDEDYFNSLPQAATTPNEIIAAGFARGWNELSGNTLSEEDQQRHAQDFYERSRLFIDRVMQHTMFDRSIESIEKAKDSTPQEFINALHKFDTASARSGRATDFNKKAAHIFAERYTRRLAPELLVPSGIFPVEDRVIAIINEKAQAMEQAGEDDPRLRIAQRLYDGGEYTADVASKWDEFMQQHQDYNTNTNVLLQNSPLPPTVSPYTGPLEAIRTHMISTGRIGFDEMNEVIIEFVEFCFQKDSVSDEPGYVSPSPVQSGYAMPEALSKKLAECKDGKRQFREIVYMMEDHEVVDKRVPRGRGEQFQQDIRAIVVDTVLDDGGKGTYRTTDQRKKYLGRRTQNKRDAQNNEIKGTGGSLYPDDIVDAAIVMLEQVDTVLDAAFKGAKSKKRLVNFVQTYGLEAYVHTPLTDETDTLRKVFAANPGIEKMKARNADPQAFATAIQRVVDAVREHAYMLRENAGQRILKRKQEIHEAVKSELHKTENRNITDIYAIMENAPEIYSTDMAEAFRQQCVRFVRNPLDPDAATAFEAVAQRINYEAMLDKKRLDQEIATEDEDLANAIRDVVERTQQQCQAFDELPIQQQVNAWNHAMDNAFERPASFRMGLKSKRISDTYEKWYDEIQRRAAQSNIHERVTEKNYFVALDELVNNPTAISEVTQRRKNAVVAIFEGNGRPPYPSRPPRTTRGIIAVFENKKLKQDDRDVDPNNNFEDVYPGIRNELRDATVSIFRQPVIDDPDSDGTMPNVPELAEDIEPQIADTWKNIAEKSQAALAQFTELPPYYQSQFWHQAISALPETQQRTWQLPEKQFADAQQDDQPLETIYNKLPSRDREFCVAKITDALTRFSDDIEEQLVVIQEKDELIETMLPQTANMDDVLAVAAQDPYREAGTQRNAIGGYFLQSVRYPFRSVKPGRAIDQRYIPYAQRVQDHLQRQLGRLLAFPPQPFVALWNEIADTQDQTDQWNITAQDIEGPQQEVMEKIYTLLRRRNSGQSEEQFAERFLLFTDIFITHNTSEPRPEELLYQTTNFSEVAPVLQSRRDYNGVRNLILHNIQKEEFDMHGFDSITDEPLRAALYRTLRSFHENMTPELQNAMAQLRGDEPITDDIENTLKTVENPELRALLQAAARHTLAGIDIGERKVDNDEINAAAREIKIEDIDLNTM